MADERHFFYSNGSELGFTLNDFNLKFLRIGTPQLVGPLPKEGESRVVNAEIQDHLTVAMSPAVAKSLVTGFLKAVLAYEAENGEVKVLPESQAAFDRIKGFAK